MKIYFVISIIVQTALIILLVISTSYFNVLDIFSSSDKEVSKEKSNLWGTDEASSISGNPSKNSEGFYNPAFLQSSASDQFSPSENQANPSDLLLDGEVLQLASVKETSSPVKSASLVEKIKLQFSGQDPYLQVADMASPLFGESELRKNLDKIRNVKVYIVAEFKKPINHNHITQLKKRGFSTLINFPTSKYLRKSMGIFYVNYRHIRNYKKHFDLLKSIYIITQYSATGLYQLDVRSLEKKEDVILDIRFPFSKTGRELFYKKNSILGGKDFVELESDRYGSQLKMDMEKKQVISFLSEVRYDIDLKKNIDGHIYVQGTKWNQKKYLDVMRREHPEILDVFTGYSEKVVPSEYISRIVASIDKNKPLSDIWRQIDKVLDQDISYDWKKRDLFFSGNLTYHNIKDMYMTAEELSLKKKGACPERTSLEIAILRELGFAARTATRLYHIYTEVFLPEYGWTTTSLTLNEIPLTRSIDENMAYFVSWSPNHPIQLKWQGHIYPSIAN